MRRNVLVSAFLLFLAGPASGMRKNVAREVNAEGEKKLESQTNSTAFFCPSLCIPCAYGDRTLFIARSKGMVKTVIDIGVVGLIGATGGWIGGLAAAVGSAIGLGSYAVGDHMYAHEIADECPTFQLQYFESDEFLAAPDEVQKLIDDEKESPMFLWKKSLSKLFTSETGKTRKTGQLPPSINAMLDEAQFLCGQHGGAVKGHMKEESWMHGMHGWATGGFQGNCKALHDEFHQATEELDKLVQEQAIEDIEDEEIDTPVVSSGDPDKEHENEIIRDEPANRVEDIGEEDEDNTVVKPIHIDKVVETPQGSCPEFVHQDEKTDLCTNEETDEEIEPCCCTGGCGDQEVTVVDDTGDKTKDPEKNTPSTDPTPSPAPDNTDNNGPNAGGITKPTAKPGSTDVPALVIKKDDTGNEGNGGDDPVEDEIYYLDGNDKGVMDTIDDIKKGRGKLITMEKPHPSVCDLMIVHSFGRKLVDGTCKHRYLAPQTCDTFFHRSTIKPIHTSRGLLLMSKDKCECYGSRTSSYCDFGLLSHVPNIALTN